MARAKDSLIEIYDEALMRKLFSSEDFPNFSPSTDWMKEVLTAHLCDREGGGYGLIITPTGPLGSTDGPYHILIEHYSEAPREVIAELTGNVPGDMTVVLKPGFPGIGDPLWSELGSVMSVIFFTIYLHEKWLANQIETALLLAAASGEKEGA